MSALYAAGIVAFVAGALGAGLVELLLLIARRARARRRTELQHRADALEDVWAQAYDYRTRRRP